MSLTVNALLLDPQGQPLANLDAQVYMFALAGTLRLVGSGRSGLDGRLSIICNFTPVAGADYQPRIQLRLKRGTAFVEASENPQSENASVCDLGTVTFNPALIIINMSQITTIPLADLTVMRDQVSTLTQTKTTLDSVLLNNLSFNAQLGLIANQVSVIEDMSTGGFFNFTNTKKKPPQ